MGIRDCCQTACQHDRIAQMRWWQAMKETESAMESLYCQSKTGRWTLNKK